MPIKTSVKLLILFSMILVTSIAYKNALAIAEIAIKQPFTVKLKPRIKVASDFANKYKNIDELLAASDVVVFGKFTGNPQIVLPSEGLSLPLGWKEDRKRKPLDPTFINQVLASRDPGHRTMTFVPSQTIKGSTSKAITVGQRGTFAESDTLQNTGDKFFQAGDFYVLFLTLEPSRSDNFYWTTGAVQGAFQVKSDRINCPQIKSESLDDFLRTIQTKVKSINSN
ncbi:hypothetical protein [Synechocystis sp. PCC 7509]|uniref:hypothetical protein n=1 Tax=Synechocystis sp. PCC 7509 TaxID=927677 RepID=UPI0002ABA9B0|nr:hypothetical protein [Synechocystis sp. PCC 7509]